MPGYKLLKQRIDSSKEILANLKGKLEEKTHYKTWRYEWAETTKETRRHMEEREVSKVPAIRGPEGEESKNREGIYKEKWPGLTSKLTKIHQTTD